MPELHISTRMRDGSQIVESSRLHSRTANRELISLPVFVGYSTIALVLVLLIGCGAGGSRIGEGDEYETHPPNSDPGTSEIDRNQTADPDQAIATETDIASLKTDHLLEPSDFGFDDSEVRQVPPPIRIMGDQDQFLDYYVQRGRSVAVDDVPTLNEADVDFLFTGGHRRHCTSPMVPVPQRVGQSAFNRGEFLSYEDEEPPSDGFFLEQQIRIHESDQKADLNLRYVLGELDLTNLDDDTCSRPTGGPPEGAILTSCEVGNECVAMIDQSSGDNFLAVARLDSVVLTVLGGGIDANGDSWDAVQILDHAYAKAFG